MGALLCTEGSVTQYFLPYYCLQQWGMGQVGVSYIFAISGFVSIFGALLGGRLSKRWYERKILGVFQICNSVTIGAMVLAFCLLPDNAEGSVTTSEEAANSDGSSGLSKDMRATTAADFAAIALVCLCVSVQNFTGAAQVTGVQGSYTHLVGKKGQGLYQSFFLASTALGRTAGAQWVGVALDSMSTQQLWILAYINFSLICVSFGWNYGRYHPEFMRLMNGDNAMLGPSGSCTSCRTPPTELEKTEIMARFPSDLLPGVPNGGASSAASPARAPALDTGFMSPGKVGRFTGSE